MSPKSPRLQETKADGEIRDCLDAHRSFSLVAGAGSGKTASLVTALKYLRKTEGGRLRRDGKKIVCITYTNRAVGVISDRLDCDDLFVVSTLHAFLWQEVRRFTPDLRRALREEVIPAHIKAQQEKDNGGKSKSAVAAREKVTVLRTSLGNLEAVSRFERADANYSDYDMGQLGHDDVVSVAAYLITASKALRRVIGQNYPYFLVDEAQDAFKVVVKALNKLCANEGLPVVGYFGDPMQQIYERRAGDFEGPGGSIQITKEENYRCSPQVITLLNAFRTDLKQVAAGDNAGVVGSVLLTLVAAEEPQGARKRYTPEQTDRACERFDEAMASWDWGDRSDVKRLFLTRRMIARRLGFPKLHELFTGTYASANAQDDYKKDRHFLLKPFIEFLCPLMVAARSGDANRAFTTLRTKSPAFDPEGVNAKKTLKEMSDSAHVLTQKLTAMWGTSTIREVLNFCSATNLCVISRRLSEHLDREPRDEEYAVDLHLSDKGDWLADAFMETKVAEIIAYAAFANENTPFSTQHGVKGEEYKDVLVVFDDTEAAWSHYSFVKTLTPKTHGEPKEGQLTKSRKLAYVCFSRAERDLRILLFTPDPAAAKKELVDLGLFDEVQVTIAD